MGGITVLQLRRGLSEKVRRHRHGGSRPAGIPGRSPGGIEGLVGAIEAGDQEPRRQFIAERLFLPTSDRKMVDEVLKVMMAAPAHVASAAMRGILAYEGTKAAARCKVPALHIAATPPLNPPHQMTEWMPAVINGWTVGAGHFNMLGSPRAGERDDRGLPASPCVDRRRGASVAMDLSYNAERAGLPR